MRYLLMAIIRVYQWTFSYDHGILGKIFPNTRYCRYNPSCSQYTFEAVQRFGFLKGSLMGMKRVARCHPGSKHPNYDPVPEK